MAVGLGYWQMMYLIVLPQALKITIPNIVNTYIGLFKDTTLVVIVGIFDFLRTVEVSRIDPKWAAPTTSATGYAFAGSVLLHFATAWRATPRPWKCGSERANCASVWSPGMELVFREGSCAKRRVGWSYV